MSQIYNYLKNGLLFSIIVMLSCINSGCMKSNAASEVGYSFTTTDSTIPPSDNTIKLVNAVFYKNFIGGEWRYKGAMRINNTINAYIQIPEELEMSQTDKENYLKVAICPSSLNKQLWQEIKHSKLSVHIYTYQRKFSTFVYCDVPVIV